MNLIKTVLEAQGRSQAWLAKNISKSYVVTTNYCNNKTQPSISTLKKIADALQVDIRELIVPTKSGAQKQETKVKVVAYS
jgi:putative transcriptional regulator